MLIKDKKINLVNIMLIIYVFSIIFFSDGDIILKIIKVIFVGVCFAHSIEKKKIYIDKYVIWMISFAFLCGISINWAISKKDAINILSTVILNDICIFFILNLLYEDKNRINLIINTIIFSSIVLGVNLIMRYGIFVFINGRRSTENGISANLVGMIAAIAGVLAFYRLKEHKENKIIYTILLVINVIIIVLSASRKALFFFLIPIIIYYVLNSKNILNTVKKIGMSVVICIVAYFMIMKVPFLYNSVGYRVETMINGLVGEGETDSSTSFRLTMIEWGIEWFKEKPYLGYGINNYKNLLGTKKTFFGSEGVYAHNNYIELLVDIGIIGTMVYYSIYLVTLCVGIKKIRKMSMLQMIMLGILIACIINEYGMVTYYAKFNQLILALLWIILNNKEEKLN